MLQKKLISVDILILQIDIISVKCVKGYIDMEKIELLSPVGDFECLKAAVQNGADAVYLGASAFSARARATNFDNNQLYLFQ